MKNIKTYFKVLLISIRFIEHSKAIQNTFMNYSYTKTMCNFCQFSVKSGIVFHL